MVTGRFHLLTVAMITASAVTFLASGCAQNGPITTRRNTVGMLKASVSQLEYSNDNLKKQVASLKSDSSRMENELVQSKDARNELASRLDDAKEVIRNQGGDVTALTPPSMSKSKATTASNEDQIPPPAKSLPIRKSSRGRKPPSAQIPRADSSTGSDSDLIDPGPQASRGDDDGRWLPVARGRGRPGAVEIR